jgi:Flp pilus assembly protein TadD/SAM-dependent methyltransferase
MNRKERRAAQKKSGPAASPMAVTLSSAFRAHQAGHRADAERLYRDVLAAEPRNAPALHLLGALMHQCGRTDDAISLIRQAIAIEPQNPDYHYNLGSILNSAGRTPEAIEPLSKAVALKPSYAEAHCELGTALGQQGNLADAKASFRRALQHKPDNVTALNNLGMTLHAEGRLEEALPLWQRAVAIAPNFHTALMNIGVAQKIRNNLDEAETTLRRALAIKPDYAPVRNNLANLLIARRKHDEALGLICEQIEKNETAEAKLLFAECIASMPNIAEPHKIHKLLVRAMSEGWTRPAELANVCAAFVKSNPTIKPFIERASGNRTAPYGTPQMLGPSAFAALAQDELLIALMEATAVADVALEHLLTASRSATLQLARTANSDAATNEPALALFCALARQCYLSEYAFVHSESEFADASALRNKLEVCLHENRPIPALWLIAVAAYMPLHGVKNAGALLRMPWPSPVRELLAQQVSEWLEEQQLRSKILAVTPIGADASDVRQQYEQNPFPRWRLPAPAVKTVSIEEYLRTSFPLATFRGTGASAKPEILVAGCGTGRHSIETGRRIGNAQVLALDLSLDSLAYAQRQTGNFGLTNIEYGQADIMHLSALGRTFDVVESVGVLHHLADPFAGWRVLLSLLRPDGVMHIGLYSETARQDIVKAQAFIAHGNYIPDAEGIRRCRQAILNLRDGDPVKNVTRIPDFFSVSECRDLLFHVQEHRVTLPQIAAFLKDNDLSFLGFDIRGEIVGRYASRFPQDPAKTDLTCWETFEAENPDTFIGMYNFWVQKSV